MKHQEVQAISKTINDYFEKKGYLTDEDLEKLAKMYKGYEKVGLHIIMPDGIKDNYAYDLHFSLYKSDGSYQDITISCEEFNYEELCEYIILMEEDYVMALMFDYEELVSWKFRTKTYCPCDTCNNVYKYGLIIGDEDHADYLDLVANKLSLKYFDTKDERDNYELHSKKWGVKGWVGIWIFWE